MLRTSIAIFACTASTAVFAAGPSLEPGLYEVTTQTEGSPPQTTRRCVTAAEIAKGMQPENPSKDCRTTRNTMGDGKLDFASTCADASMTVAGSYTATTFKADMALHGKTAGTTFDVVSHTTAKKVGATCKPE